MKDSNLGEDIDIYIKTHEEILKIIEEIKEFENKFQEYDLSETQSEEELIEVDDQLVEFVEVIPIKKEEPRKRVISKRQKVKENIQKEIKPTIFHLRLNKDGKLENIDIKKPPAKKKSGFKLRRKKKEKGETKEKNDKKTKLSKFKGGFNKLKKAIPSRKKKTEDTTEPEE